MDGNINGPKQVTVSLHTNWWFIKLQYNITLVSLTIRTGFTETTINVGHEISQIPTSPFSSEPKSTGCANFTVKTEGLISL